MRPCDSTAELNQRPCRQHCHADGLLANLSHLGWALVRIEQRLTAIEASLGRPATAWTPSQWCKLLGGLLLPLLVLMITGNVELARRMMMP